jgi:hypothetical protein
VSTGVAAKAIVTIKNTSTSTSFGSANVTVPSGFTPCTTTSVSPCASNPATDTAGFGANYVGSTLQVRNQTNPVGAGVGPGATITVNAWVKPKAACTLAAMAWAVAVRSTNNFVNGTLFAGGPTTPVPFLRFTTQPLVSTQYNSDMAGPPKVTSLDGCGVGAAPVPTITLTDAAHQLVAGHTTSNLGNVIALNGVQFATFDYPDTLTTSAAGYTPDTSSPFLVAQKVQPCSSGNCPPLTLDSQPQTNAIITPTASPGQANALVSGSALDPDNSLCNEGGQGIPPTQISSTIAVDAPVSKTVTFTIAKPLVQAISNNGTPFMNVCMRTVNPDGTFTDVTLPNCPSGVSAPPACVVSRGKNKANEIIVVRLPVGDPHFNVH